jgi:hypothetical protein
MTTVHILYGVQSDMRGAKHAVLRRGLRSPFISAEDQFIK